jgi:hypothetical protein
MKKLYERIDEPHSGGGTHLLLARIAASDVARDEHVAAARAAWLKIHRPDLIQQLEEEFNATDVDAN